MRLGGSFGFVSKLNQISERKGASIRDHTFPEGEKGNKKILTGRSVPLDTCLLMGDPVSVVA